MRSTPLFVVAAVALALAAPAPAQSWPEKPLRFIVPFAPGGVIDTLARVLQPRLTEALGQPIVIENRAGASGNIGAESVVKSAGDGYTFLVANEALAINPLLYRSVGFDLYKDLAPVAKLADFPIVMVVHPSLPANTVSEFVALARARPEQISFGSAGVGATGHLAGELFKSMAGVEMAHVPYKGGAQAANDLLAGHIQAMFLSVMLTVPQARQGKLKALAVVGRARAAQLPQVPTIAEAGYPEFVVMVFSAMLAPQGTSPTIINRMNAELVKVLRSPDMQKKLADLGGVPAPSSPDELVSIFRHEAQTWGRIIREKNIRAD